MDFLKGNIKQFEMSRYIDLELYHKVERQHPFYEDMIDEIHRQVKLCLAGRRHVKLLEVGAGTGILTEELLKYDNVEIDALDYDSECCEQLQEHVGARVRCICDDAVTFFEEGCYDLIVSSFAHDHINYDRAEDFAANIMRNLKPGGAYIMGGELLPEYSTPAEREEALYAYHGYIVDKALRDRCFLVAQIEINALKSGLEMVGDFKRHELMFENEMDSAGFKQLSKKKMGPLNVDNVGGVFVYVYGAPSS